MILEQVTSQFRILKDWKIAVEADGEYKGQVHINVIDKVAIICPWELDSEQPKNYILHELLHVCLRAIICNMSISGRRKAEEEFVQDLCSLIM